MNRISQAEAWLCELQPDVVRTDAVQSFSKQEAIFARITTSFNVNVEPHFLTELHVSVAGAAPNAICAEHLPQLHALMTAPITCESGHAVLDDTPGLGISGDWDAISSHTVS